MRQVVILAALGLLVACDGEPAAAPTPEPTTQAVEPAAALARYVCPMHPEVTSAEPGKCGECGMDLVAADGAGQAGPEGVPTKAPTRMDGAGDHVGKAKAH